MRTKNTCVVTFGILILAILCMGCGASRQSGYLSGAEAAKAEADKAAASQPASSQPTSQPADPMAAMIQEAAAHWDKREDVNELRKALTAYEKLATDKPDNRQALARLARGYYLLAYGYLKDDAEKLAAYDKGASWGERIMGLRPEFRKKVESGIKDYKALDVAQKEDLAGIYWSYANLGKWSAIKGFLTKLKNKTKLKAFITRVAELDKDFYYGAGDRGLGAFYAIAPAIAGGDPMKAIVHFNKSLAAAPNYLGTKVLMARELAGKKIAADKTLDKAMFKRLLKEVLAGDPKVLPDAIPIQKIEQRKARELLDKIDEIF